METYQSELEKLNSLLDEVSSEKYATLGAAAAAVYTALMKFEILYNVGSGATNLLEFVTELLEQIVGTNDEEVFKIVKDDAEFDHYFYITADEYNGMYEVYAQVVNEEELQDLQDLEPEEEVPGYSYYPYTMYLRNARRSADD